MISVIKKAVLCIPRKDRKYMIGLLILVIVKSFLSAGGIAIVMPFVSLVVKPDIINDFELFRRIVDYIGLRDHASIVLFFGVALILYYLFNHSVSLYVLYRQTKFWKTQEYKLSSRLLKAYLYMPYEERISHNTADLYRNISSCVNASMSVLNTVVTILADIVFVALSLGMVLYASGFVSVIVGLTLGTLVSVMYLLTRRFSFKLGESQHILASKMLRSTYECLQGVKDIKIYKVERIFVRRYVERAKEFARKAVSLAVVVNLPGSVIEMTMVGIIVGLVLFVIHSGLSLVEMMPLIALYAVVTYKLLPVMTAIVGATVTLRTAIPAVEVVYNDIEQYDVTGLESESRPVEFTRSLRIEDVHFAYPDGTVALQNINLEVQKGQRIAIVGRSGAGKSTLVDLLLGLLRPQSGNVFVDDQLLTASKMRQFRALTGYVSQEVYLLDDTITRNITFGWPESLIDFERVQECVAQSRLENFIDMLDDGYDTLIGERGIRFSGGQRQRLGIARALYHNPEILVFDEATSALDGLTEKEFSQELADLSAAKTVILIAHRISTARECDTIYYMEDAKIVSYGSHDELYKVNNRYKELCDLFNMN